MKDNPLLQSIDNVVNFSESLEGTPNTASPVTRLWAARKAGNSFWSSIAQERGNLRDLLIPYGLSVIVIPALIGTLTSALLWGSIGAMFMGSATQFGLLSAVTSTLWLSLVILGGILAAGKVIQLVVPTFGFRSSWVLSCRLLIYGFTPFFIAGAFSGIPLLGWLMQIAAFVYSVVLVFQGFGTVLKVPAEVASEPLQSQIRA
jgi:hypothetical protein